MNQTTFLIAWPRPSDYTELRESVTLSHSGLGMPVNASDSWMTRAKERMELVRHILIYVASAVLAIVVRVAKGVILLVVPKAMIGQRAGLVTHAVLNILLNSGLVYLVVLLSKSLGIQPVLYMLMPAIFLTVFRCRMQRDKFRSGRSMEESIHKRIVQFQGGRSSSDYRALLLRREYVNEITSLLGFLLGALLLWWLQ